MTYNETELKTLVIEEAQKLLVHATAEERGRLDFTGLDPGNLEHCIYGQMTECCFSQRADVLLDRCGQVFSGALHETGYTKPGLKRFPKGTSRDSRAFSPIEYYISIPKAKNATLIQFLRGERETLTVDDL